jgi:hypothetical protein
MWNSNTLTRISPFYRIISSQPPGICRLPAPVERLFSRNFMNEAVIKIFLLAAGLNLILAAHLFAGAPFLTDDPVPVDYQHWETYLFGTGDHTDDGFTIQGPAAEIDYGVLPDTQLHLAMSLTTVGGDGKATASGFGDIELGVKYRFVHETNWWPQIAIFPTVELPTGDAGRGLGNGRAWFKLPLWTQKSWGPWTTDVGGGAALNSAPGQRNYPYGGWLLQREIGEHLTLGGEIFAQGAAADGDQGTAALNFGVTYHVNEHFSLLFSAGHSIAGEEHTLWYFAFTGLGESCRVTIWIMTELLPRLPRNVLTIFIGHNLPWPQPRHFINNFCVTGKIIASHNAYSFADGCKPSRAISVGSPFIF